MSESLGDAALNALASHVAVLDSQGRIVAVNEAWKRFARDNGGDSTTYYVGSSYLEVCERAMRQGDAVAAQVRQGIGELLEGSRDDFSIEYPLRSPQRDLWFQARIRRFHHQGQLRLVVTHEDTTARRQAQILLQRTESMLRNVLDTLPVGVWIIDGEGQIALGNPAGQRIWCGARFVGPEQFGQYKGWWLSTGEPIAPEDWAAARAIRNGETSIDEEIRIQCFDGSSKIILNSGVPLRDEQGHITGAIIVNQDITARVQNEARLREASAALDATNHELQEVLQREQRNARTDELTGLSNRRHFFERAIDLFAVAQRYGTPLSVLLFDVDRFKRFNDRYGHQAGDNVLEAIAREARKHVREADVFARYGGEEFIIALPNTPAAGAHALAEAIGERIAATRVTVHGRKRAVTVSIGVAELQPGDSSIDQVVSRADHALYQAKAAGRNCSRTYGAHA